MPSAYTGDKGWDQEIDWVPENAATDPVATDGEAVAYLLRSGDGYAVQVRDGATGKVRWTSAPYRTPVVDPDAPGIPETPGVTVLRQGERTYVAAWATGEQTGDALTKDQEVVQVDVYPVDAAGDSVAPLHHVAVPVDAHNSSVEVGDGGAGLLITGPGVDHHSVAIDLESGKVTRYEDAAGLFADCDSAMCINNEVVAVTPQGPVVSGEQGGIAVPGGWAGEDIAPEGVETGRTFVSGEQNGDLVGVRDSVFVARWQASDDSDVPVWSAHDLTSGRLLAATACADDKPLRDRTLVVSPNGRHVAYGPVAFDTETGKALCLAGDETRRTVTVGVIGDDGTAYGVTDAETAPKPVIELNVSGTAPKALPEGTLLPAAALKGGALFTQRENGSGLRVSVRLKG
ncbi:hypothetical protein [Streptomyces sp. AC602_WCS936]|uniref:hypothetical protein n=1 Tax=Streptomyces sp. AC602_WCS936 TaxID=2823685 RepID=UPI0027E4E56A|nr:hypothetical protein [Streptomyces sp. AC602_WCS936]